jgi:hypothetical protein
MTQRTGAFSAEVVANNEVTIEDVLERFPEVGRIANAVYEPEGVRLFLTTPMSRFGGRTAMQLLEQGQEDKVLSALAADYEGLS